MATGTIATLRTDRGFGFIRANGSDNETDNLFFHHTAVVADGFTALNEGDTVTFEVVPDPRNAERFRAINVEPGSASTAE